MDTITVEYPKQPNVFRETYYTSNFGIPPNLNRFKCNQQGYNSFTRTTTTMGNCTEIRTTKNIKTETNSSECKCTIL